MHTHTQVLKGLIIHKEGNKKPLTHTDYSFAPEQNLQLVFSAALNWDAWLCCTGHTFSKWPWLFLEWRQGLPTIPSSTVLEVPVLTFAAYLQAAGMHCKHCWTQIHPLWSQQYSDIEFSGNLWWKLAWYCSLVSAVTCYRSWAETDHLSFPVLQYDPSTSVLRYQMLCLLLSGAFWISEIGREVHRCH